MCNACGFYCCAMDCFGGCGCEWCPDPECFDDTNEDYQDSDELDCKPTPQPRFFCDSPLSSPPRHSPLSAPGDVE